MITGGESHDQDCNKAHKEEVTELKQAIYDLRSSVSDSMTKQEKELTQAINNNTIAMQRLADKIGND